MRIEVRVSNMYSLPKMLMTDIIFKLVRMDLIRHVCVCVWRLRKRNKQKHFSFRFNASIDIKI